MKRKFLNFSLIASVGLLAFSVASCGSSYTAPKVEISQTVLNMQTGETQKLSVRVEKAYLSAPVYWFTSNESVAYFRDENIGYLTAVGEGTATVTAMVAGGVAKCQVFVTSGEVDPEAARFTLQSTASVEVGNSVRLTYSVNPVGSTLTFSSSDKAIADVDNSGTVTGLAAGTATITGVCSNGLTRTCTVTVSETGGGGGGGEDLDIGVLPSEFGRTGELVVGSPQKSQTTMQALISAFKQKTNSTVNITIKTFEEGEGAGNFPTGAASGPDVFPYVSDQTMTLNSLGALAPVANTVSDQYETTMLDGAITAATWNDNVLGYPFAADNGVVMFYDKSVVSDPSEIDTIDKLFTKAQSLGKTVSYDIPNSFYAASILHTFNNGKSMFTIKPTSTSYKCSSTFACENGLQGMKLAYSIMTTAGWQKDKATPSTNGVLATIIDTSNVREFKEQMGNKYAVAPVPYVDDTYSQRICTYLGYKFYGVNNSIKDADKKNTAKIFAKFLVSEYAQKIRYDAEKTQPTLKTLQSIAQNEPHIAALNQQKASGSTQLLSVFGDEYFNNTGLCILSLQNDFIADDIIPTDADMYNLLEELDNSWRS